MIRAILWDVDGTLLSFHASEKQAMTNCFRRFGLGSCTPEMLVRYSVLNDRWWKALERGEVTRAQLLPGRFGEFFRAEGIPFAGDSFLADFNDYYQIQLGETIVFHPGAYELVRDLRYQGLRQYAVTNGTRAAQVRKLARSGLDLLLDGIFISEEVGAEKPDPAFFVPVLAAAGPGPREELLIVGDSLTSDMKGGSGVGLRCCWFDPQNRPLPEQPRIHYHIQALDQLREILAEENR